ncbi:hypothetical protein D3C85_1455950 [compost metagenome]
MGGQHPEALLVLAYGGQRRAGVFAGFNIVTTDHGYILRDAESMLFQGADRAEGQ